MTPYERIYLLASPGLLPLYGIVRKELRAASRRFPAAPAIVDIGGRKSQYTIGIRGNVTITDLPRESAIQHDLHLGITDRIIQEIQRTRSNVRRVCFDDMSRTSLPPSSFDIAVCVEVLEHVQEDARFIENVDRVLKPGGCFIATTPNGDAVRNTNPDHVRHYTGQQLRAMLEERFPSVRVLYAVRHSRFRARGLYAFVPKRLLFNAGILAANAINRFESRYAADGNRPDDMRHLLAVAWKDQA